MVKIWDFEVLQLPQRGDFVSGTHIYHQNKNLVSPSRYL